MQNIDPEKFIEARKSARLTQERAAEIMGISKDTVSNYERGLTDIMPQAAYDMSNTYHAPELKSYYCSECPLGKGSKPAELKPVERIALQLLKSTNGVEQIRAAIADITADGVIDSTEIPMLEKVLAYMDSLEKSIKDLRLWAEKNVSEF